MATGTPLNAVEHTVIILFDPALIATDPFSYVVDDQKPEPSFHIPVDADLAVFQFFLQTQPLVDPSLTGRFASSPLQWLSPAATPITIPPPFYLQRTGDTTMTLINLNPVRTPDGMVTFNFEISVVYAGRTYSSSDPTIINVQPPPPSDEKVWQEPQEQPATALVS